MPYQAKDPRDPRLFENQDLFDEPIKVFKTGTAAADDLQATDEMPEFFSNPVLNRKIYHFKINGNLLKEKLKDYDTLSIFSQSENKFNPGLSNLTMDDYKEILDEMGYDWFERGSGNKDIRYYKRTPNKKGR